MRDIHKYIYESIDRIFAFRSLAAYSKDINLDKLDRSPLSLIKLARFCSYEDIFVSRDTICNSQIIKAERF